ncbi:MAG: protein-L-isoaspartate(D-aspartate) O-methyltransferase [Bacteroidales bacterium]|nr:protein-L-isoaspartate(D-aspartate) O-methyltransferase [Bacteroidales bacterium]MDD2204114.1 protein-L-isoaspartate(D-aspartate) O-methyltransferase [Bacteroidales bacterium]MDD3152590.1 protein-L-isoaspartate(D-aspartate) O-methyltransferase [Bacteroidales bacterium]MDD3913778.1 protein-L-isoaspartate(D-aspartate) O-methyltransferase [Bacteroidales bacterium]MDD4633543.1 protein-L-isoaspartate(D-aspartate) O-methyltransferase [Bacteroidales bacterium]
MEDNYRHQGLRRKLVDQIRKNGICDEVVLEAIFNVPRHFFIDSGFVEYAYEDKPFSIGCGQTISQPSTVAAQSELLQISKGMKVLEIGTGSGYQAAVLSAMGARVFTIERQRELYFRTKTFLAASYPNIKCFLGDGYKGLKTFAPFDRIIVTAAAPFIPEDLKSQLKIGGRMVIPIDDENNCQKMCLIEKTSETEFTQTQHGDYCFVPMLKKINE